MTAAPLRRMTPEETEHPSRRRGGLGRWVAAVLVVTMFTLSAAIVWLAWLDGAGLGADEPPPLIQAEPGAIKRLPDAPGGQAVANEDSSVVTVFGRDREALRVEQLLPREAPPPLVPPPEPAAPPEQADAPPAATPELADAAPADADPPAPLPSAVDPPEVAALEALEAPEPLQAPDPLPAPPPSTRIGPMPASPTAAIAVAPPSAETAPATRTPVEVPAAIIAPRQLA
ncbi:MAG TPA: hypothetical protein VFG43_02870, partial [Geminicoccaceae bacterium]|nr:hypothetical protein [Geminicoccaceae bacterium]